jgi:hypothetical protein
MSLQIRFQIRTAAEMSKSEKGHRFALKGFFQKSSIRFCNETKLNVKFMLCINLFYYNTDKCGSRLEPIPSMNWRKHSINKFWSVGENTYNES